MRRVVVGVLLLAVLGLAVWLLDQDDTIPSIDGPPTADGASSAKPILRPEPRNARPPQDAKSTDKSANTPTADEQARSEPSAPTAKSIVVTGRLKAEGGVSLANVQVYLQRKGITSKQRDRGTHRIDVPVTPAGRFHVRVPDPENYWLLARPSRGDTFRVVSAFADAAALATEEPVELTLKPGRVLRVEVRDEAGARMSDVFVSVMPYKADANRVWPDPGSGQWGSSGTSTNGDGDPVRVTVPDDGPVRIRLKKRGFAALYHLAPPGEDDLVLTMRPASGEIRVVLTNADAFPHAVAWVSRVIPEFGTQPERMFAEGFRLGDATFKDLSGPGSYVVRVSATDAEAVTRRVELTTDRLTAQIEMRLEEKAGLGRLRFVGVERGLGPWTRMWFRRENGTTWRLATPLRGHEGLSTSLREGGLDVLVVHPGGGKGALVERALVEAGRTHEHVLSWRKLRSFRVPKLAIERDHVARAWVVSQAGQQFPVLRFTPRSKRVLPRADLSAPKDALRHTRLIALPIHGGNIHWVLKDGATGRAPLQRAESR